MTLVLLIAALILFILAAIAGYGPTNAGWQRINLVALGLACWVGSQLIPAIH